MWNGFDVDMPPGYHGRQRRPELRYPRPMVPIPRIAAWLKRLSPAIGIACFALALLVLGRALRDTTPEALARQLATFPRGRILAAAALTVLDFLPLIGLDWFALRAGRYERLVADNNGVLRSGVFPGLWLDVPALLRGDLTTVLAHVAAGTASQEHAAFVARLRR